MIYRETDPRVLAVLERALSATSRATRVRAVAMLACAECDQRMAWLDTAAHDDCRDVRDTALAVAAWVLQVDDPPWPKREDAEPVAHAVPGFDDDEHARITAGEWEYVVEVWRDDALLVGVFLAAIHEEDDEHAKCIALGQAVLASVRPGSDEFEPGSAAAFIVGKRRVTRRLRAPRNGLGPRH